MRTLDLEAMDFSELWLLHERMTEILAAKISAEKRELERRLAQLNRVEADEAVSQPAESMRIDRPRRKYPKVLPKYCNPSTTETWSGRGKQPRWLVAALQSGHKLEEYRIDRTKEVSEDKVP